MAYMVFGNYENERDRGQPRRGEMVHAKGTAEKTLCGRARNARRVPLRTREARVDPRFPDRPAGDYDIDCTACRKALGLKPQVR